MNIPLILFFMILASIIFMKWRQKNPKEKGEKSCTGCPSKGDKDGGITKNKARTYLTIASGIFIFLLWIIRPSLIEQHYKEVFVIVAAIATINIFLDIWTTWEKSWGRKALMAGFFGLAVAMILMAFHKDFGWLDEHKKEAVNVLSPVNYPVCAEAKDTALGVGEIEVLAKPFCWSGDVWIDKRLKLSCDTDPEAPIYVRLWDGRIVSDWRGNPYWAGDKVKNSHLRFATPNNLPVKVTLRCVRSL